MVADRDLWVTHEGVVVEAKDVKVGTRIIETGAGVTRDFLAKYDLEFRDDKLVLPGAKAKAEAEAKAEKGGKK